VAGVSLPGKIIPMIVKTDLRYSPYPSYRDSGLPWLGQIPAHWEAKQLKRLFFVTNGSTPSSGVPEYWDGDIVWVTPEDLGKLESDTLYQSGRRITQKGYQNCGTTLAPKGSLILSTRAPIGHLAIAGVEFCTNQGCRSLVFRSENEIRYFYYLMLSVRSELQSRGTGTTFAELGKSKLESIELTLPPLPEQRTIAAYLGRATAKIDALIAKKQRLLDLLAEQRAALISQAVTKGNAINKVQKDKSPAPWLFPLPAGWQRQQLKHISFTKGRIGYENLRAEEYTEEGPYLVSSVHFKDGKIEWERCNHVTRERFEMSPDIILQKHDVLFMKDGAMMGKLAYVDELPGEACLNSHILLIRPLRGSYLPKFLFYVLMTDVFKAYMEQQAKGTTFLGFSEQSMGNFPLSLPTISGQKEICDYIDQKSKQLDDLAIKAQDVIERLREYRLALISSAVTGKIQVKDVRI
jgi:type I restriction enzyme S subunit